MLPSVFSDEYVAQVIPEDMVKTYEIGKSAGKVYSIDEPSEN